MATALFDNVQNTFSGHVFITVASSGNCKLDSRALLPRAIRQWDRNRVLHCRNGRVDVW